MVAEDWAALTARTDQVGPGVRVYVDGIAPDTATITATTNEAFTASCVVTVTA